MTFFSLKMVDFFSMSDSYEADCEERMKQPLIIVSCKVAQIKNEIFLFIIFFSIFSRQK